MLFDALEQAPQLASSCQSVWRNELDLFEWEHALAMTEGLESFESEGFHLKMMVEEALASLQHCTRMVSASLDSTFAY